MHTCRKIRNLHKSRINFVVATGGSWLHYLTSLFDVEWKSNFPFHHRTSDTSTQVSFFSRFALLWVLVLISFFFLFCLQRMNSFDSHTKHTHFVIRIEEMSPDRLQLQTFHRTTKKNVHHLKRLDWRHIDSASMCDFHDVLDAIGRCSLKFAWLQIQSSKSVEQAAAIVNVRCAEMLLLSGSQADARHFFIDSRLKFHVVLMNFTSRRLLDRKVVCAQLNFLAVITDFVRACHRLCRKNLWIKLSLRRLLGTKWVVWKWSERLFHWDYVQLILYNELPRPELLGPGAPRPAAPAASYLLNGPEDISTYFFERWTVKERAVAVDWLSFGGSCRWVNLQMISSWAHHKRTSHE